MTNTSTEGRGLMTTYLTTAETIVREGGAIARELFGKVDIIGDHGQGNVFTKGDIAVDDHICKRLSHAFPEHDILSEESGHQRRATQYLWILDPIDGTRYFHGGVPLYSISLALQIDDEDVIGIVYNPETDQLFSAMVGHGASLNGSPMQCSTKQDLDNATLCLEIPHRRMSEPVRAAASQAVTTLMARVDRVRVLGASALGLCYCANGAFDLFLSMSTGTNEWDVAAGKLILRESGAVIVEHGKYTAGGSRELLNQLLQILPTVTDAQQTD